LTVFLSKSSFLKLPQNPSRQVSVSACVPHTRAIEKKEWRVSAFRL
jgi:hypothetical protein